MLNNFFEIDFINIRTDSNADAIALRYSLNEEITIHVIDAGYEKNALDLVDHIKKYYNNPKKIDHLVLTHPDQDHISGMIKIIENFEIGTLWMNRPWLHSEELFQYAEHYKNIDNFEKRLRKDYSLLNNLEKVALDNKIEIKDVFLGCQIGEFIVLSPSKEFYLDMLIKSNKNKELKDNFAFESVSNFWESSKRVINYISSCWGEEIFPDEDTAIENETSVIQYMNFEDTKEILLTGDAGKLALQQVINLNLDIFPFNKYNSLFQIPHHGSRRNLSSEILDNIFGIKDENKKDLFSAVASVSSIGKQTHPKKAVVRALMHRGGRIFDNRRGFCSCTSKAPKRDGWCSAEQKEYPEQQEE